jgi:hypothetical protein
MVEDTTEDDEVALELDDDDSSDSDSSDGDAEVEEVLTHDSISQVRKRGRGRPRKIQPDKVPKAPSPPPKARKVHILAPKPPPRQAVKLRLKLPARQRRASDAESPKKDVFEDILSKEEADVSQTSILGSDKNRFEKAKMMAEVSLLSTLLEKHVDTHIL